MADRVQRRVWHAWRAQLGRQGAFAFTDPGRAGTLARRSAWSDLHRTYGSRCAAPPSRSWSSCCRAACRRGRRRPPGRVEAVAADQLPADAHGYGRRRTAAPAATSRVGPRPTAVAERARIITTPPPRPTSHREAELREQDRRREAARIAAEAELAAKPSGLNHPTAGGWTGTPQPLPSRSSRAAGRPGSLSTPVEEMEERPTGHAPGPIEERGDLPRGPGPGPRREARPSQR